MNIFVDMFSIPQLKLLEHYLPIMSNAKDIYLKEYMQHSDNYSYNEDRSRHEFANDFVPVVDYEHTIRGQRAGSCSIRRLWALGKLTLGLNLYMEFKVRFLLSFIAYLHKMFPDLVNGEWKSPRASVWLRVISTPFLEMGLLKQLNRLASNSALYIRLRDLIFDSVKERYPSDVYDNLKLKHKQQTI